jgi:opacity protein-like surface antigen
MRFLALATLLVLLIALPASAQIGPPQPRASQYGWSMGVGVQNVQSEWTPYHYDVDRTRIYLEGSYGFTDSVEAFGRAGVSDWVVNDIQTYEPGDMRDVSSDGYPAFVSGGLRGTAWRSGNLSVGASFEAAWYVAQERDIRWDYDAYQELYFDSTVEFTLAVPVGYEIGRSILYGGPLVHFGYTRVDVRTHEFGPDWEVEDSVDAVTIRDKGGCGGFLGWRTPIGENGWHLQIEGAGLRGGFAGALGFYRAW